MTDIVLTSAVRTPIGSFLGQLKTLSASALGAVAIKESLARAQLSEEDVGDVIMGQVLTAACGQNPARQAAIEAGLPYETPALTVNQVCGSGLRAVALAYQAILEDNDRIVVAGGQESMSQAPHASTLRLGKKMGDLQFTDTMIKDGLWCATNGYHMGITAENVATKWQITREQQDAFAALSQNKAEQAMQNGAFKQEITPVTIKSKKGDVTVDTDEYPRAGVTADSLSGLRPAFDKEGSITAGNASGINDGAAAVTVMSAEQANKRGIKPLARIASWATCGVDPAYMGIGPVPATRAALKKAGWQMADVDLIEANEAFAAQACAVAKELDVAAEKVNVHGGAIALGHPIGASGARVLTTLLYAMQKHNGKKGVATLCIGGGMGISLCVESI
ncbi:MAG: acetyl-CoA C-acetyltransferase [Alphaproteobacteria bacterium GM202ARS2]|nr:acetyl-CoA C-acetyltransferase [Alphaproteobacteria bacterium GM202ARS2]